MATRRSTATAATPAPWILIMETIFPTVISCAVVGNGRVAMLSVKLDELIYRVAGTLIDPSAC
jgi:hypothetical protein